MKTLYLPVLAVAALAIASFAAPASAHERPCQDFTRTLTYADGSSRNLQGTACLQRNGTWRIVAENEIPAYVPPPFVRERVVYYRQGYQPHYRPEFHRVGYHDGWRRQHDWH